MRFLDTHSDTMVDRPLVAVLLQNGQRGVFVNNNISCINAFDFEKRVLSRHSIAGNVDTRYKSLDEAVAEYNESCIESKRIITFGEMKEESEWKLPSNPHL